MTRRRLAVAVAGTRLLLFLVGAGSVIWFGFPEGATPPPTSQNVFLDLPARWDTGWYLGVAHGGYRWDGRLDKFQNIAFFPAYPLLYRATAWVVRAGHHPVAWLWTGVLLSNLLFAGAAALLFRLSMMESARPEAAATAVLACACYPFSLFFSLPYTESLFLLACVGAFERLKRGSTGWAGLLAFVAGFTRPNGWLLSIPLAMVAVGIGHWCRRPSPGETAHEGMTLRPLLVALAPVLGVVAYSAFVYGQTGHPLMWAIVQESWGRGIQNPVVPLQALATVWAAEGSLALFTKAWPELVNLGALAVAVGLVWPVTRSLGLAYGCFVALNAIVPYIAGGPMSMGRYTSVLFPVFMWIGFKGRATARVAVWGGLVGLSVVAGLFFTWRRLY